MMTSCEFMKCFYTSKRNGDWFKCVSLYNEENGEEHKYGLRGRGYMGNEWKYSFESTRDSERNSKT